MIEIVPFESQYANAFRSLNEEWIKQVFEQVGEEDQKLLEDPEKQIISHGGAIMIALMNSKAIGTCALIYKGNETYELAKMAVAPEARGNSAGEKLGMAVIEKAKALGAKKLYLETHSVLTPAINLYKKLGFLESCGSNENSLCNLQMELKL